MADHDLESDRDLFAASAEATWSSVRAGDAKRGSKHTKERDSIVAYWVKRGQCLELLQPLLVVESEEIRYAAASQLLANGAAQVALAVLEDLEHNSNGLVAPTARLLLLKWRQQHMERDQ